MGIFLAVIFLLSLLVVWGFLTFTPKWVNRRAVWAYNWALLAVAVMASVPYIFATRARMLAGDPNEAYFWPVVAALGAFGLFGIVIFFAFIVRNYFVFRPTRMKGRW